MNGPFKKLSRYFRISQPTRWGLKCKGNKFASKVWQISRFIWRYSFFNRLESGGKVIKQNVGLNLPNPRPNPTPFYKKSKLQTPVQTPGLSVGVFLSKWRRGSTQGVSRTSVCREDFDHENGHSRNNRRVNRDLNLSLFPLGRKPEGSEAG